MSANEKLLVATTLDKILSDKYSEEDVTFLGQVKKGSITFCTEKLWLCLSVLESGLTKVESVNDIPRGGQSHRREKNKALFEKTFTLIKDLKINPYYPKSTQTLRNSGHTIREAAIRGAAKTLALALITKKESPELMARIMQNVASLREIDDPDLANVFDIMLHFNADISTRNNALMKNIDATLGGQSLIFRDNIEESEVLSLINNKYYPFFTMLAKHNISYVTPLTLKYHLLVTNKTPIDYLMICQDEERAVTLTLMGS